MCDSRQICPTRAEAVFCLKMEPKDKDQFVFRAAHLLQFHMLNSYNV